MIGSRIQEFLKKKLEDPSFNKNNFIEKSGIPFQTIYDLKKSSSINPSLTTVIKLANYFDCSIDEVLGKKTNFAENTKFKIFNLEVTNSNLRSYIRNIIKKNNINHEDLCRILNFNRLAIFKFIQQNSKQQSISSALAVGIADYFNVSLDEMTGRVESIQVQECKVDSPITRTYRGNQLKSNTGIVAEDNLSESLKKDIADIKNTLHEVLNKQDEILLKSKNIQDTKK